MRRRSAQAIRHTSGVHGIEIRHCNWEWVATGAFAVAKVGHVGRFGGVETEIRIHKSALTQTILSGRS